MPRRVIPALLVMAACGGAQRGEGPARDEAPAEVAVGRSLPAPPPGCRELTVREMPEPRRVTPMGDRPGLETEVLVAGARLVVLQHEPGAPARGEMYDPRLDAWIDVASDGAPRFGSFEEGPGPLGSPRWRAFEDWIVVTWLDGNRSPRFSGAVFDARRNAWRAMSSDGMPDRLPEAIEVGAGGALVRLSTDASGGVRYDVRADRWSPIAPAGAPSSRVGAAVVAADGRVMVWGGQGAGLSTDGAVYDVRADRWTPMSTAGAPSPRLAPFAAPTASGMVVWSGAAEHGSPARLSDGGVYDARADRWTSIPASGAPDPSIGGIFPQDLAWTGEALLYRELPGPDRGLPRRLALYDLARERWWRTAEASHVRPVVLAHGRVLLLDPAAPRVLHAREELACPVDLGRVPLFGNLSQGTSFAASALIGDELVLWGRVDVEALRPPCPPGAPCMPAESAVSALPRGVVITP